MGIREEFRIDSTGVRQDLEKIEAEVKQSTQRQTQDMAAEGRRSGEEQAKAVVKSLRDTFNGKRAQLKTDLATKVIDKKQFRDASNAAKKAFNDGILKAMDELEKKGELSAEAMDRLGRSLKSVGSAGRESGKRTESAWSKAKVAVAAVAALIAGSRIVAWFKGAVDSAKELGLSFLKLSASAKLFGVSQAQLNELSQRGVRNYGLSIGQANDLATTITKLTAKARESNKAFDLQARLLDLAAAQGMNATEANLALDQALRGIDEGTDKLFQKNPSDIYKQYAAQLGKTAGQLTTVEQKQAIVNATLTEGAKVQGAYGNFLKTDIGRLTRWDQLLLASKQTVGAALIPILADLTDLLAGPLQKATDGFVAMLGGIRLMAVDAAVGLQDLRIAGLQVRESLAKIPLLGFLAPDEGAVESAMKFRAALAQAAEEERAGIISGGFTGARGGSNRNENTTPPPAPDLAARQQLADTLREFGLAKNLGLALLSDTRKLPPLLERARTHYQAMLQIDKQIAGLEAQKKNATAAQLKDLNALLAGLRAQRSAENLGATLSLERQGSLMGRTGILDRFMATGKAPSLFEGARLRYDPMIQKMGNLRDAVQAVATAQRDLTQAELEQDQAGQVQATQALATAKQRLRAQVAAVAKAMHDLVKDDKKYAELQAKLEKILKDAGITDGKQPKHWDEVASSVEGVARGVLSVADAMGVLDDQTRKALQGVIDLAEGFTRLEADPVGGMFQILGGAVGLLGGLFGGGDSQAAAEAKALQEAMREQARVIRENTQALKDFQRSALSGTAPSEKSDIVNSLQKLFDFFQSRPDQWPGGEGPAGLNVLQAQAKAAGIDEQDFLALLEKLQELTGVNFFDAQKGITDVSEFLRAFQALQGKDIAEFGSDLSGRLDALNFMMQALGDAAGTAEEQLQKFLEALRTVPEAAGFADELEKKIKDQGPEAAKAWLQGLAKIFATQGVTPELQAIFGEGLTADEIGRAIEDALKYVGGLTGDTSFSRSTQIQRSITEVQANEVVAWLQDVAFNTRDSLAELAAIHDLLAVAFGPVSPATPSAALAAGSNGLTINGDVSVQAGIDDATFWDLWRRLGEEMLLQSRGRGL